MTRKTSVARGAFALALCLISYPALAASSNGWSQEDTAAARIRELQTKLMVATLRCRAAGVNILASYNQFIATDRDELRTANDRLKLHYMAAAGPIAGQQEYDRYTTALANRYGATEWGPRSCERAARLANEAIAARGNLIAVAQGDTDISANPPVQLASTLADDRPFLQGSGAPQADDDRSPPPDYSDRGPPPGLGGDDRSSWRDSYDQANASGYVDRGPSLRYGDDGPSPSIYEDHGSSRYYDDDRPSAHAYNDREPPPGYDDWRSSSRYDDWSSDPGYYDRAPPPGYDRGW
jgi:hypothetical protein